MDYMELVDKIWKETIQQLIEGVFAIRYDGLIIDINEKALEILKIKKENIFEHKIRDLLIADDKNDVFYEAILQVVFEKSNSVEKIVPYFINENKKELLVRSSYLISDGEKIGILVMLQDVTELQELRDAIIATEKIKALNQQLEMRNELLQTAFGRYMSDSVVKELLNTPDGLEIKGKQVKLTIMMSDLRGFTTMSEHIPPEDLIELLNNYLEQMTKVIAKYKGTIIELLGDGILVIFGAPQENPNHASDAIACAIAMQNEMQSVNEWNQKHGYGNLEMGIGLNTGEVIVGNIGSEMRTKYAVTGKNVNLCGRIESYTIGGQTLISPETVKLSKAKLTIDNEIEVYPKGAKTPIIVSSVSKIAEPYNLEKIIQKKMELKKLSKTVEVDFRVIRDKHVSDCNSKGVFVELCEDGGILSSTEEMSCFENLEINIGGQLYAKLTEKTENGWLVTFTSKPTEFRKWLLSAN